MRNLVPSFSTSFHPSSFLPPSFAFVILLSSLDFLSSFLPFPLLFRAALVPSFCRFPCGEVVLSAGMVKITLFLYNAHIHRSYCNLVRSRFRVIGGEKYFHRCGTPRTEGKRKKDRKREWLVSRKSFRAKITRRYKFTVKTKSFWHVLVPPLSLLDVYRCGSQSR